MSTRWIVVVVATAVLGTLVAVFRAPLVAAVVDVVVMVQGDPPPPGPRLELDVGVDNAEEAQAVPFSELQLRFSGSLERGPCWLHLLAIDRTGAVHDLVHRNAEWEPGPMVDGGAFRLPGIYAYHAAGGPIRFFAVCGSSELRPAQVRSAIPPARDFPGGGEEWVRSTRRIDGLPEGTAQATRLTQFFPSK